MRRKILAALGGLPDYDGPLNARITGRIQADGYVIEKVIYESLPGFYVTANLYRPNRPGRYPAVFLQAGHTQEGKAEPQWLAANLALERLRVAGLRSGGARRKGADLRRSAQSPGGGLVRQRTHPRRSAGQPRGRVADALLHLGCQRSIDYLVSRPEVDPQSIGAAGLFRRRRADHIYRSAGLAAQSGHPCLFSQFISILLFTGADPHSEMTLPGHLAIGLDTADFVELSAPTPWLIQATEQDYFTPPGARMMYEEARRWYRLYGAEDEGRVLRRSWSARHTACQPGGRLPLADSLAQRMAEGDFHDGR